MATGRMATVRPIGYNSRIPFGGVPVHKKREILGFVVFSGSFQGTFIVCTGLH